MGEVIRKMALTRKKFYGDMTKTEAKLYEQYKQQMKMDHLKKIKKELKEIEKSIQSIQLDMIDKKIE